MYKTKIPQEKLFVEYCDKVPQNVELKLSWNANEECYEWNDSLKTKVDNPTKEITPKKSLLLASGAYSGEIIKHLLDGYSVSIILRVEMKDGKMFINFHNSPVESDTQLYESEKNGARLKSGLFTSDMPWWKKMLGGNLFKFLCGELAIERETAHQPIYYPVEDSVIYCSGSKYHAYKHDTNKEEFKIENNGWIPNFPSKKYLCMHPHYDQTNNSMLTYTFAHSIFKKKTSITFYEFGENSQEPLLTDYVINDRAALHMFGFTKNYYILFSNSLALEKCGQFKILFGKSLLRTLDDTFWDDLVIHFIPRPNCNNKKTFSVDTNLKGFVYHTINCFENDNSEIVIDAFVSDLNALRESAQFELEFDKEVYDNNGDPHRFIIRIPNGSEEDAKKDPCKSKLSASVVDSTIDFHCINHDFHGLRHKYTWIVGHNRERDENGEVVKTVSSLHKIEITEDNLEFNNRETVKHFTHSTDWLSENVSCYLRTPLFVPSQDAAEEDDGYIFAWSYEFEDSDNMSANILIFSAIDLELLMKIPIPKKCHVPYSVHSWIYPFNK